MALPFCTRRLWPRPRIRPLCTRTEPMGMPPSARPRSASSIAAFRNSSMTILFRLPPHRLREDRRRLATAPDAIRGAGHHDAGEPAEIGAAEQPGRDRALQRGYQAVLDRPAGEQAEQEGHDGAPVDVAIDVPGGLAIELA